MAADSDKGLVLWKQRLNNRAQQTVMLQGVGARLVAQQTGSVGRLTVHPGHLPHRTVTQAETSRYHVVSPHHEASATIFVAVLAEGVIVLNRHTMGSLEVSLLAG